MKERRSNIVIGQKNYLEDGTEAWAQVILPEWENVVLTNTEEHETIHAVVGEIVHEGSVEKVSTEPGPGYLGYTQMSFMTAEAAIAPDALHMRGTHHDRRIVRSMKANEVAAATVARKIVGESHDEIKAVGFRLKKKRTISGHEVRAAMRSVQEGREVEVFRRSPDGTYQTFRQQVTKGTTIFQLTTELPLAA